MFWLSHHHDDELDRTYSLAGVRICARCLGVYPVLLAALAVQIVQRAPLQWRWDGVVAIGLFVPAVVDWAYGRFRPHALSNPWRTFTGVLLGVSLGRTLYIHFQRPFPLWLLVQMAVVTAVALPVILVTLRRKAR